MQHYSGSLEASELYDMKTTQWFNCIVILLTRPHRITSTTANHSLFLPLFALHQVVYSNHTNSYLGTKWLLGFLVNKLVSGVTTYQEPTSAVSVPNTTYFPLMFR